MPIIDTPITDAQRDAIAAQAAVYDTDDCPGCEGLHDWRAYDYADDPEVEDGYPNGAVAVDFLYRYDDGELGRETTVFALDGSVLDSQDWG
jgi:hypothetical protein